MSRVEKVTRWFLDVEPERLSGFYFAAKTDAEIEAIDARRLKEQRDDCHRMIAEIKRHCDTAATFNVQNETKPICGHCGAEWTEGADSPHNGGCCDEDAKAMPDDEAVSP